MDTRFHTPAKRPCSEMSDPDQRSVLSRMIAAQSREGPGQAHLEPALQSGLSRALRRAGLPFDALVSAVAEVRATAGATLTSGIAALPENALLAALEDNEGRRGLLALEHQLVDALIEVQATGHVEETDLPPRRVTKIDEALCRDFIDLVLVAFAQETGEQVGRDWPERLTYGSAISDRSQLNLLMSERGYRLLEATVTMGGRKTGRVVILIPCDPAIARQAAIATPDTAAPVDWSTRILGAVGRAPMVLDAVLMRVTMPYGEVRALQEGDLVPFDASELAGVTLENAAGDVFARGSLGQLTGRRAIRFGEPSQDKPPAPQTTGSGPSPPNPAPPAGLPALSTSGLGDLPAPLMADMPRASDVGKPADFDPNAPIGGAAGFDPDAPMAGLEPLPDLKAFDPNAPMG